MLHCPTCGRHYDAGVEVCAEDGAALKADSTIATSAPGPEPASDPMIGRTLDDKYRLDERLGEGGMGTVYRATHLLIDRPVAIKVLNPRFVEDEAAQTRFRREARAAGRLRHGNAVAVTDFGRTSDGFVYIVMELLEGRSLRDLLAREGPFDAGRAVSLMMQISAAVGAAHDAGIIHRDLKPSNIFIVQRRDTQQPFVKVLDFGIAKLAAESVDEEDLQTLTQVGVMIGTPRYMSPEQCDGAPLSPASDVYSLGIILYEMLTGATPFNGATPLAIAMKHSYDPPKPPRELEPSIPEPIEWLILRALVKRPEQRPKDANQFRRELRDIAERLRLAGAGGYRAAPAEEGASQTPSGRVVIDIDRLREPRAPAHNTHEQVEAYHTIEEKIERAGSSRRGPGRYGAAPIARLRIFFEERQSLVNRLKRPPALIAMSAAALVLLMAAGAFFAPRPASDAESAITTPSPVPSAAPLAAAGGTPASSATPAPETGGGESGGSNSRTVNDTERRPRHEPEQVPQRRTRRYAARPSGQGGIVNKLKHILKNPF